MTEKLHKAVRLLNEEVTEGRFSVSIMPILLDETIEYRIPGLAITVWDGNLDGTAEAIAALCWGKLTAIHTFLEKDLEGRNPGQGDT